MHYLPAKGSPTDLQGVFPCLVLLQRHGVRSADESRQGRVDTRHGDQSVGSWIKDLDDRVVEALNSVDIVPRPALTLSQRSQSSPPLPIRNTHRDPDEPVTGLLH